MNGSQANVDSKVVHDFGEEWSCYDQSQVSQQELETLFNAYFKLFPKSFLNKNNVGADFGCGSGRWANFIAPHVKKLYCIDASNVALSVSIKKLNHHNNLEFINAPVNETPLPDNSLDFAYSLGVLHHIPDTLEGIKACVKKLKTGAPFLVYLYYAFDNKSLWFRLIWQISNYFRIGISKLPFKLKLLSTKIIAATVYYPLARAAKILEKLHINVNNLPLSSYRNRSFYSMKTDALDRFGTRLEQRFTRNEIADMFAAAGLINVTVSTEFPYWCAVGYKA